MLQVERHRVRGGAVLLLCKAVRGNARGSGCLDSSLAHQSPRCRRPNGSVGLFPRITSSAGAECCRARRREEPGASFFRAAPEPWRSGHRGATSGASSAGPAAAQARKGPRQRQHEPSQKWRDAARTECRGAASARLVADVRFNSVQLLTNCRSDGIVASQSPVRVCFLPGRESREAVCARRKSGALSRSGSQSAAVTFQSRISGGRHGGQAEQPDG